MQSAYLFRTCCLRITDNPGVIEAAKQGRIAAGYSLGDWPKKPGANSMSRLRASLCALDEDIKQHGGRLWIGDKGLAYFAIELARMAGVSEVYTAADPTPQGKRQEEDAIIKCRREGVTLRVLGSQLLHDPTTLRNKSGNLFKVFTPFWQTLHEQLKVKTPDVIDKPAGICFADHGPGLGHDAVCSRVQCRSVLTHVAGEKAAKKMLREFIDRQLESYAQNRDYPARQATSKLSAALRFGEISPARIYAEAVKEGVNADKFLSEVGWREFSHHVLHQHPDIATVNIKREYDRFPWSQNEKLLDKWRKGVTGIPMVDAGMRELRTTGYMQNRVRMLTASFLTKNLLQDWRLGAEHFWDELIDGDLANNYASWQWVAGCGCDAAPYFRIFNPVLQGKRFDRLGEYVCTHLPVLARLPDKYIHDPWCAPPDVLQTAGVKLGDNYSLPIVDLVRSRKAALEAYKSTVTRKE